MQNSGLLFFFFLSTEYKHGVSWALSFVKDTLISYKDFSLIPNASGHARTHALHRRTGASKRARDIELVCLVVWRLEGKEPQDFSRSPNSVNAL